MSDDVSDEERQVLGRKLLRWKTILDDINSQVFSYADDIGRQDLPVGLVYLVDALIDDLLMAKADPVIHLDAKHMYSTLRVAPLWEPVSSELGITLSGGAEPVIINLPGLDPFNALFSPILAHEVGHSVIQTSDLVAEVARRLDPTRVDELRNELLAAEPEVDVEKQLTRFGSWVEELLCDALATELTGPGLLFSAAAFLPASSAGSAGPQHPDAAQRIGLALDQLDRSGWLVPLGERCPTTLQWLRDIAEVPPLLQNPLEDFLRSLVAHARPVVMEVASEYVEDGLSFSAYSPYESETSALFDTGIPPAELAGNPVSPWVTIAGVWLYAIRMHGDDPESLVLACEDGDLSRFALKTVEMSRVLQLWSEGN